MRVGFSIVAGCVAAVAMLWAYMNGWQQVYSELMDAWAPWPQEADSAHIVATTGADTSVAYCLDESGLGCIELSRLIATAERDPDVAFDIAVNAVIAGPGGEFVRPSDPAVARPGLVTAFAPGREDYPVVAGHAPNGADEVALSDGVAAQVDVEIGDTITIRPRHGEEAGFVVTGLLGGSSIAPPLLTPRLTYVPGPHLVLITIDGASRMIRGPVALGYATITWSGDIPEVIAGLPEVDDGGAGEGLPHPSYPTHSWWWATTALALALASAVLAWRRHHRTGAHDTPLQLALLMAAPTIAGVACAALAVQVHHNLVMRSHPGAVTVDGLHPHPMWTMVAICLGLAVSLTTVGRARRTQHPNAWEPRTDQHT